MKKLIGLDNLSESILPEKSKQFINYGSNEDVLTLTLNEDVSANIGYLAALYKTLTWSKVNGKKMIPDNLLRFDMEIVVTESKKFNRINKNTDNTITQYADFISRYRYTVYECQFFFDKMSHGDSIDMWNLDTSLGFDLKVNYKFSTVKFEKITNFDFINNVITINYGSASSIDNSNVDLTTIDSKDADGFFIINNSIVLTPIQYSLTKYSDYAPNSGANTTSEYRLLFGAENANDYGGGAWTQRLANKFAVQNSNSLSLRDQLLQATLNNLDSEFGFNLANLGSLVVGKLNAGFTEDGYEYNIAAHYVNKAINTTSNLLGQIVNPIVNNIYAEKVLLQESVLMNINKGINFISNQLNGGGQKQNIYGNGGATSLVYSGDNVANDDPNYTPPHNSGIPFSIYSTKQNEPDTPPHTSGTTFDIYANTKEEPDTPPHNSGAVFDIYNNTKEEPDTPPHNSGAVFDIYSNTKEYPDFPLEGPEPPTFDIYSNKKEYPYTPAHTTGKLMSIYGKK